MTAAMKQGEAGNFWSHPAIAALASLLLYFGAILFPPTLLALATPLYYLLAREGVRTGGGMIALAASVILVVGGLGSLMIYSLLGVLTAISLSWAFRDRLSLFAAITRTVAVTYAAGFILLAAIAQTHGLGIGALLSHYADHGLGLMIDAYHETGASQEMVSFLDENRERQVAEFVTLFPSIAFAALLLTAVVNTITIRIISLRNGLNIHFTGRRFREWQAPEGMVWLLIVGGVGYWLLAGPGGVVGLNILFSVGAIYLVQGVGVVDYYLSRFSAPALMRAFIYFFIFSQPLFLFGVSSLGLADIWADFRNLHRQEGDSSGPDA